MLRIVVPILIWGVTRKNKQDIQILFMKIRIDHAFFVYLIHKFAHFFEEQLAAKFWWVDLWPSLINSPQTASILCNRNRCNMYNQMQVP